MFYYKKDLSVLGACSAKGFFSEDSLTCTCSGNTYFDKGSHDCLCPAGHIWSEKERTCIESICPEGAFESLENGCVPCDEPTAYKVKNDDLLNRSIRVLGSENRCIKSVCDSGEEVAITDDEKKACTDCGIREVKDGQCVLKKNEV